MADNKLIIDNINEEEGIAWLTLNRPEKKNALSIALLNELVRLLGMIRDNDKIRCIVTRGAGDSYSSGRDLYDMRSQSNRSRNRGVGGVAEIVSIMRSCPQVTVAAVKGWCLGGGLAMINGHDLVISADTAKFGMPEDHSRQLRRHRHAVACFTAGFRSKRPFTSRSREGILPAQKPSASALSPKSFPEKSWTTMLRRSPKSSPAATARPWRAPKSLPICKRTYPFTWLSKPTTSCSTVCATTPTRSATWRVISTRKKAAAR